MFEVDARPILPLIHAPTLVLHRSNFDFFPIQHGRYLAEHIPGASPGLRQSAVMANAGGLTGCT
jgi:pimeloyl-ACP methyl ester carboxylesterase